MKLLKRDYKHGIVTVLVDQDLDLWHLSKIVKPGDIISGSTERKILIDRGDKKESYRKKVFLAINVEKVSWEPGLLRITGRILDGPEDVPRGEYHSFNVKKNDKITIKKDSWGLYKSLLEGYAKTKEYCLLVLVFDRHEATIARINNTGYRIITTITLETLPKEEQGISKTYRELATMLEKEYDSKRYDGIIIGSPGFFKDYLLEALREELKKKAVTVNISYGGAHGVKEVLRNNSVQELFSKIKTFKDSILIEELKECIAKGLATYGLRQVRNALELGAVEKLLISEKYLEKARIEDNNIDELLSLAEAIRAEINIINESQELEGLGGIAAILRYKIENE